MVRARPPTTSVPPSCSRLPGRSTARHQRRSSCESAWRRWRSARRSRPGCRPRCLPSRTSSSASSHVIERRAEWAANGPGAGADRRGCGREAAPAPTSRNARSRHHFPAGVSFPSRPRECAVTRGRRTQRPTTRHERAPWRARCGGGPIQFGLVTIPVRLYLATDSKGIAFNMLHASLSEPDPDEDVLPVPRRGDLARRHGQGIRVREGPVRRDHRRGSGERPAQDRALDRDREVRPGAAGRGRARSASSSRPTTWSPSRSAARRTRCCARCSPSRASWRSARS